MWGWGGLLKHTERGLPFGVMRGVLGVPTCWQSVADVVPTLLMWAALGRACSATVRVRARTEANAAAAGDEQNRS